MGTPDPVPGAGLYVYGVMRAGDVIPLTAVPVGAGREGGAVPVSAAAFGGLAAIVTPAPEGEIARTRRNMLAHTRILEALMPAGPILPMRFGIVAASAAALTAALLPRETELGGLLVHYAGCAELGVRAAWPREACLAQIAAENPELAALHARAAVAGTGAYQARIDLGRRVADLIEAWRRRMERALLARLAPHARTYSVGAPDTDMTVLRAEFLVDLAGEAAVLAELAAWNRDGGGLAEIRCVGPAPIYNFVSLHLDAPQAARARVA